MVDITNVIATLNFIKLFGHSACNFFFHFFLDKKVDSRYRYALGTCGKKSRLQKNAPDIATLIGIFDKNWLPRLRKTSSILKTGSSSTFDLACAIFGIWCFSFIAAKANFLNAIFLRPVPS
jgi:hypothetical protein